MPSADKQRGNSKKVVGRPFEKGKSGNPKGRPPKGEAWADVANKLLESKELDIAMTLPNGETKTLNLKADKSFRHAVIIGQINAAIKGSVAAARELADRTEGRAIQKIEQKTEFKPIEILKLDK